MENKPANELIDKYLTGQCTELEKAVVETWFNQLAQQKKSLPNIDYWSMNEKIIAGLPEGSILYKKKVKLWVRVAVAAAIAIIIFGTGLFYYASQVPKGENFVVNDVGPGRNGATLTLANGQKILINDALAGNVAIQSGVKISKSANGQIIYEITNNNSNEIAYNTLSTTRGEQTQVRLPDGTLVYLNAESSLKYPTSFAKSDERKVSLAGEGYFEVAKDKAHPFIVESNDQHVEVLGTHFNVNTYANETSVKTTLLEGSVKINNRILKPNQQAVLTNGQIKILQVDVEHVVSWKNGNFLFEDEPLSSIMRKIERWYDVDVIYDKGINTEELYWGGVSRYDNVSKVLRKLALTGNIHFKIEGRRVTVMR